MSQEVHSLLMLLSLALLQHAQELRVLSDGVWCVDFRWSLLAIQLAVDAAPYEAHDVLRQGACRSTPADYELLATIQICFIPTVHETVADVDSMTGQGHRHTKTDTDTNTDTQHQPVHMQCNSDPSVIVQQMPQQAEQIVSCNQLTKQSPQHTSVQQAIDHDNHQAIDHNNHRAIDHDSG